MLPEFPKGRRKMLDLWNAAFFSGMNGADAFVSQIPVRVQKEGSTAHIGGGEMDYKLCSVNFSFPARDAQGMTEEEFLGAPFRLGSQMAGEHSPDAPEDSLLWRCDKGREYSQSFARPQSWKELQGFVTQNDRERVPSVLRDDSSFALLFSLVFQHRTQLSLVKNLDNMFFGHQ